MHCVLIFFAMFNPHSKASDWYISHHYELMNDAASFLSHYSDELIQNSEQIYVVEHSVIMQNESTSPLFNRDSSYFVSHSADIDKNIQLIPHIQKNLTTRFFAYEMISKTHSQVLSTDSSYT